MTIPPLNLPPSDTHLQTFKYEIEQVLNSLANGILLDSGIIDVTKLAATIYASQSEAEAGTENTKLMTPLRTKQAVNAVEVTATGSSSGRSLPERFAEVTNVSDFGATGDGVTDDTTALQAAFTAAASAGRKLYFPPGIYVVTTTIGTITASDWLIYGPDPTNTRISCSGDTDIFKIDVSSANLFRITIKDIELFNSHATGASATGIRVVASTGSATGLKESKLGPLRFRGMGLANIYIEEAGRVDDGGGNITIQPHAFNVFKEIHCPQYTRYPTDVIRWEAGNGPHNRISGGRYRAAQYGFRMGNGSAGHGVGDFTCEGVHFVGGTAAFKINGPSDDQYRTSINVVGCQFDGMSTYVFDIDRLNRVNIQGNNFQVGVDANITNCDLSRSVVETRDEIYIYGARFDYFSGQTDTLQVLGGDGSTQNPGLRALSPNANASLDLRGKGGGKVFLAAHYANYLGVLGSASAGGVASLQTLGADTNISLLLEAKGTGEVRAPTNRTNYILFQGANASAGVTIKPEGSDTNIVLNLFAKGNGAGSGVVVGFTNQRVGFYGTTAIAKQTGVAVTAAGIHAALVNLGLIT